MLTIQKYLAAVLKHSRFILYSVVFFTFAAVVISLVIPVRYQATVQILPPTEDADMFSIPSILGSDFSTGGIGSLLRGGGILRRATPADLIVPILESRTIQERVIEKCGLMRAFRIKKSMEKSIKKLRSITSINITDEGVVRIDILMRPATLSAQIANTYVDELDKFLRESNMSRGRNTRLFIENRLPEAEEDLRVARDSLTSFQRRHKTVVVDEETKAAINTYAQLKSQLLAKEIEYALVQEISAPTNPYLSDLKREVEKFRVRLAKIEAGEISGEGFGAGFAISFRKLPSIMAEYADRVSTLKIKEEIYLLLIQQYEHAKIVEARDTPLITVLDYARVPEKKTYPKRFIIVISVFLCSLVVAVFASLVAEYVGNLKTSRPNEYKTWLALYNKVREDICYVLRNKILPLLRWKKARNK